MMWFWIGAGIILGIILRASLVKEIPRDFIPHRFIIAGYQPKGPPLDKKNPPKGGSGVVIMGRGVRPPSGFKIPPPKIYKERL